MRKCAYLLGMVLLLGLTAAAQERPTTDVFLGYSYVRAKPQLSGSPSFNLNGGSASVAFNPSSWYGIVGDFGGYHVGSIDGFSVNSNLVTYMFGPRVYLPSRGRIKPFAHALFGGAHSTAGVLGTVSSENAFAMALGGGLDVHATKHASIRLGQFDYLLTRFREEAGGDRLTQNNLRFSTGIVFRF